MRLQPRYVFVLVAAGLVLLYFAGRTLLDRAEAPSQAQAKTALAETLPGVQVRLTPEVVRDYDVVMRGRTQAARTVEVKSETAGLVAATPVLQGTVVRQGAVLCRLSVDARKAALEQARAALRASQLQHQAAIELARKGYRSQTQVLQAQANLDAAQAQVRQAEIALRQVDIRAPFTGVFDRREAEVGTYLSPGQTCGAMIELDPLLIVGDVPETDAAKLSVGDSARATLVGGGTLNGRIRYVARDADPQTRTYHLEITVPNRQMTVRSGLSADVRIAAGQGPAHLIPVSSLVLDSAGRQGVRYLTGDNRVAFAPVTVIEQTSEGAWVRGLRGSVRVITVGQSYVAEGQRVRAAPAL